MGCHVVFVFIFKVIYNVPCLLTPCPLIHRALVDRHSHTQTLCIHRVRESWLIDTMILCSLQELGHGGKA